MKVPPHLVWTRPASDWPQDEILLKAAAGKARIERIPCVKIVPLPSDAVTGSFDAVIFTSSKAADLALGDPSVLAAAKAAKGVYTHGPSTAKTLLKHGLSPTVVDVRTGQELGAALKKKLAPGSRILWPRVEDPAHDLEADLSAAGFPTQSFVCYRTETRAYGLSGEPLAKARLAELARDLAGVACFASPSAVEGFLKDLPPDRLIAVALGPTTAEACAGRFKTVFTATENGLEALVNRAIQALNQP